MKKVLIILSALIILSMPFQYNYLETNAAIFSKAAGLTAKKVAKEVIQDSAINQAIRIAADETKKLKSSESRLQKEGHMLFCMDYTYKPGGDCKKPANIKQNLTETDKANIKKQSGTELDKLTSPSGKGFTKWQKFLDWFVPIWLITFAVTAITYAIDPDVKSLFDEAAYNALVALGIISPVHDSTVLKPVEDSDVGIEPSNDSVIENNKTVVNMTEYTKELSHNFTGLRMESYEFITTMHNHYKNGLKSYGINVKLEGQEESVKAIAIGTLFTTPQQMDRMTIEVNGEYVWHTTTNISTHFTMQPSSLYAVDFNKTESIRTRLPYKFGDFWYTDVLVFTVEGDLIKYELRHPNNDVFEGKKITSVNPHTSGHSYENDISFVLNRNDLPYQPVNVPNYDESEMTPTDDSSYQDENGNMALLPPVAFTYEEEGTGEQVERKQAPNGDGYVWQKPDGTEVPEENVIPREEEEPRVTPSPEGTPQYTPAPTPSNPNPEPVPLQPEPTAPPAQPENPPTDPTIPDGQSCGKEWELPSFEPLEKTMSEAFPFSIPWDMQNALESAFGTIGNERPSFTLDMGFAGASEWEITLPKFFDEWKPFTDTLLIFIFDIGIMFGIYRFMKGGSS